MGLSGRDEWEAGTFFTEEQVRYLLEEAGVEVDYEDSHGFRCYCPFHNNTDSPAMSVSGETGWFKCFNPACDEKGNIYALLKAVTGEDQFQIRRRVVAVRKNGLGLSYRIQKSLDKKKGLTEFTDVDIPRLQRTFAESEHAQAYMLGRGFLPETCERFGIGYSEKKNMIVVPVHDHAGMLVGFVGRSADPDQKKFHNSMGLPRYDVVYNMHRAKRSGSDTLIVVEASFNAMKVDQAGFPNVGAFLGGTLTDPQAEVIKRHFRRVIIMTDDDKPKLHPDCRVCPRAGYQMCIGHNPGREAGRKVEKALTGMTIRWAAYDEKVIYPEKGLDPADLDEAQITKMIDNSVSSFIYNGWRLDR